MSVVTNYVDSPTFDGITGLRLPEMRAGILAPNGDAQPWKDLPVGTLYWQANDKNPEYGKWFVKRKKDERDDDWTLLGMQCLTQRIAVGDFTDGGAAAGTLALTEKIPQGAWVQRAVLRSVTGFTGDTSAVMTVGDGTDVDRYNTGTPSVFTTANAIDLGAPSGTQIHTAEATVTVTITGNSDFGAISAGAATICIYYLL